MENYGTVANVKMAAMQEKTERLTYDIETVAKLLGVGRNQAYEAVKSGQIPSIQIGKRKLVPKVWVDRQLRGEAAA